MYIYLVFEYICHMKTRRAYKERFYPAPEQETLLVQSFGCARFVYNNTLCFCTDADYKDGQSVSHFEAEKRLVSLKKEFPFLADVSSVILKQALRDKQEAFKKFWAGRAKYPKFKKKHSRQRIRLTKAAFNVKNGRLFIAKSKKLLNIRWSRKLSSEPSSITISKGRAGRYLEPSPLCPLVFMPYGYLCPMGAIGRGVPVGNIKSCRQGEQCVGAINRPKSDPPLKKSKHLLSGEVPGHAKRWSCTLFD